MLSSHLRMSVHFGSFGGMRIFVGLVGAFTMLIGLAPQAVAAPSLRVSVTKHTVIKGGVTVAKVKRAKPRSKCTFRVETDEGNYRLGSKRANPNGKLKFKVRTSRLPLGNHTLITRCKGSGRDYTWFEVTEDFRHLCRTGEHAYSLRKRVLAAGFVLRNESPSLDATDVDIRLIYRNGQGNAVEKDTVFFSRIPAGQTVELGSTSYTKKAVKSLALRVTCSAAVPTASGLIRGTAQVSYDPDWGWFWATGVLTNTYPTALNYADIYFVTRNAAGQITGGGSTYVSKRVAAGQSYRWTYEIDYIRTKSEATTTTFVVDPPA